MPSSKDECKICKTSVKSERMGQHILTHHSSELQEHERSHPDKPQKIQAKHMKETGVYVEQCSYMCLSCKYSFPLSESCEKHLMRKPECLEKHRSTASPTYQKVKEPCSESHELHELRKQNEELKKKNDKLQKIIQDCDDIAEDDALKINVWKYLYRLKLGVSVDTIANISDFIQDFLNIAEEDGMEKSIDDFIQYSKTSTAPF